MIRAAICDDEPTMLDYLHEHISVEFKRQSTEVQIDKFILGEIFLNAQKAKSFDVVFLDIDMPEISGFDIAEKIKGNEPTLKRLSMDHSIVLFYYNVFDNKFSMAYFT